MPNHITNILFINEEGEKLQRVLDTLKGENGAIDFEKLTPMPKEEEDNWYEWRKEHWGTKWNAYDINREIDFSDENHIVFNTAWSAPMPIYKEIAELLPDCRIYITYADEDCGFNCGEVFIRNGEVETDIPKEQSDEAYCLYLDTHPMYEPYFYRDDDLVWRWHDEPDYNRC